MASKFQKADSTKWLVGISVKPRSKKIWRNSSRTLRRGCNAPPSVGCPCAAKLYCLNSVSFHLPEVSMSELRSVSSTLTSVANWGPLVMLKWNCFLAITSLRFINSLITLSPPAWPPVVCTSRSWSAVSSTGASADRTKPAPSFAIHLFLNARPWPTLTTSSPRSFCCQPQLVTMRQSRAEVQAVQVHNASMRRNSP